MDMDSVKVPRDWLEDVRSILWGVADESSERGRLAEGLGQCIPAMLAATSNDAAIRALSADRGEADLYREDEGREPCGDGCCGGCRFVAATPPSPAESAAPSGVSDADAEKVLTEYIRICMDEHGYHATREDRIAAMKRAIATLQPQPGRVAGMAEDMTDAMMDAGQQYLDSKTLGKRFTLPPMFNWHEFWQCLTTASQEPDHG